MCERVAQKDKRNFRVSQHISSFACALCENIIWVSLPVWYIAFQFYSNLTITCHLLSERVLSFLSYSNNYKDNIYSFPLPFFIIFITQLFWKKTPTIMCITLAAVNGYVIYWMDAFTQTHSCLASKANVFSVLVVISLFWQEERQRFYSPCWFVGF